MQKAIRVHPDDNVATALDVIAPGEALDFGTLRVMATELIERGHKLALRPIARSAEVIKYGSTIGLATQAIQTGVHVHVHNLESQRGRGDHG